MTFTLFWRERSSSFAPHALLIELALPFTAVRVDSKAGDNQKPAYLALNPTGRIPTLALPDSTVMTESAAMVLHLAESRPEANLLPPAGSSQKATLLRWLFFSVSSLYETDLRYSYPDRYTADPKGAEGVRQAGIRDVDRFWAMIAAAYGEGPYFFGRYTVLDLYVAPQAAWHYAPKQLFARHPVLGRLVDAVRARPAIAELWKSYNFDRDL